MSKDYGQVASDESLNNAKVSLEANGFSVEIVDNLKAAHDRVVEIIPGGADIFTATSVTLTEAGRPSEEIRTCGADRSYGRDLRQNIS